MRPLSTPITPGLFPCPACGGDPVGTIDTLICHWSVSPDGIIEDWAGNDLNTQETLYRDGRPVLVCIDGHDYTHKDFTGEVMLTLVMEDDDGNPG